MVPCLAREKDHCASGTRRLAWAVEGQLQRNCKRPVLVHAAEIDLRWASGVEVGDPRTATLTGGCGRGGATFFAAHGVRCRMEGRNEERAGWGVGCRSVSSSRPLWTVLMGYAPPWPLYPSISGLLPPLSFCQPCSLALLSFVDIWDLSSLSPAYILACLSGLLTRSPLLPPSLPACQCFPVPYHMRPYP